MRGGMMARVLVLGIVLGLPALGCAARDHDRPRPKAGGPATKGAAAPAWTVESNWMATTDEAVDSALEKVERNVHSSLEQMRPPLGCRPERAFIRERLVKDLPKDDGGFEEAAGGEVKRIKVVGHDALEETKAFPDIGQMRRVRLRVEVKETDRPALQQLEREYQEARRQASAGERQTLLLKGLGGAVAVLGAVAVYLRLESAARGVYSKLRRPGWAAVVAVATLVALLGAGLFMLG